MHFRYTFLCFQILILSITATVTARPNSGQYQPGVVISLVPKKGNLRVNHHDPTSSARLSSSQLATGDAASADMCHTIWLIMRARSTFMIRHRRFPNLSQHLLHPRQCASPSQSPQLPSHSSSSSSSSTSSPPTHRLSHFISHCPILICLCPTHLFQTLTPSPTPTSSSISPLTLSNPFHQISTNNTLRSAASRKQSAHFVMISTITAIGRSLTDLPFLRMSRQK